MVLVCHPAILLLPHALRRPYRSQDPAWGEPRSRSPMYAKNNAKRGVCDSLHDIAPPALSNLFPA